MKIKMKFVNKLMLGILLLSMIGFCYFLIEFSSKMVKFTSISIDYNDTVHFENNVAAHEITKLSEKNEFTNILILSYPRSGSSLLGEIFLTENSSYIFEPLLYYCKQLNQCEWEDSKRFIEKIFQCDGPTLFELIQRTGKPTVLKIHPFDNLIDLFSLQPSQLSEVCQKTKIRVIKTIRIKISQVLEMLRSNAISNLKVVHLLRDPRARFNSLKSGGNWKSQQKSISYVCDQMELDLKASVSLPKNSYVRIRYEDLVGDPVKQIDDIFQNIFGHRITSKTKDYVISHVKGINSSANYKQNDFLKYFNTNREMGIDLNQWQKQLIKTEIQQLENQCRYVLDELKYELLSPML